MNNMIQYFYQSRKDNIRFYSPFFSKKTLQVIESLKQSMKPDISISYSPPCKDSLQKRSYSRIHKNDEHRNNMIKKISKIMEAYKNNLFASREALKLPTKNKIFIRKHNQNTDDGREIKVPRSPTNKKLIQPTSINLTKHVSFKKIRKNIPHYSKTPEICENVGLINSSQLGDKKTELPKLLDAVNITLTAWQIND